MFSNIPVVCLLLLSLVTCQFMAPKEHPGALTVAVAWPVAKAAFQVRAIPVSTSRLEIRLEGDGLSEPLTRTLKRGAKTQETLTFTLPPGPKSIQVQALDTSGKILAADTTQVEIVSGQKTTAVLELKANTPELPGQSRPAGAPGLPGQTQAGVPALPAQGQAGTPNLPTIRATQPSSSPAPAPAGAKPAPPKTTVPPAPGAATPGTATAGSSTGVGFNPILNSLSPTAVAPGGTLTITGTGFGLDRPESLVYIGANLADILSVTSTQITVTVPSTAGSLPVRVQVGAVTSNSLTLAIAFPGSTTAVPVNKPPVINTLVADPSPVSGVAYPTELTVSATDPEGPLTDSAYTWSCDGGCGAFNKTNGTKVTWTAPPAGGNYIIRVTVSDGSNPPVVKTLSVAVETGSNTLNLTTGGNGIL